MTVQAPELADQPPPPTPGRRHGQAARWRELLHHVPDRWVWRCVLAGLGAVSFATHVTRVYQSYDLFIDESFYAEVGQSIAKGHMPYATGVHFFLHPPGFFLIDALWMKVFGLHSEVFAQVYSLRNLVAIFAALTTVMIAVIVEKALGRRAALLAALFYTVSAFANRDSAIVILEPATVCWALAGHATLLSLRSPGTRARRWQVLGGGFLLGISVLSKEFAVFITVVPLALMFVFKVWISRREALLAASMALMPYTVWVIVVAASGNWHQFAVQFRSGFSRTAGTTQISGFNRPGAPSFLHTLLLNIDYLWTAYTILGLGSLAILYLAWRRSTPQPLRYVAMVGTGALPLILYCVFIGTNEEQFFNFLLAPALICLLGVITLEWSRLARAVKVLIVALAAAGLIWDLGWYTLVRTVPDNGTYLIDTWMAEHVPPGTVIAVTNSVQREIFLRYTMLDDDPGVPISRDARYLVVFYKQVDENYAFIDRASLDTQTKNLHKVYETADRSNGTMTIFQIPVTN